MFISSISQRFKGYEITEEKDTKYSFSSSWENLSTIKFLNKQKEPVRVDIRLAYSDITKENLVDFIDYIWLQDDTGIRVAEYYIVYIGKFSHVVPEKHVPENFLIGRSCKKVSHLYINLDNEELLEGLIKSNFPDEYNRLLPVNLSNSEGKASINGEGFGLRARGIIKKDLPGNPLISIIIPSFNSESIIEQALQSALVQSYKNKEIIVVDGGSKDGTASVVRKYEDDIDWFNSEPDKNIFDAINKGTYLSKGKYSVFIGSDDVIVYNALEKIVESISIYGEKDFFYGNGLTLTTSGFIKKSFCYLRGKNFSQFKIYHPALYIRRDVFVELEGFDTEYFISADADFELKLISLKKSFSKIENFLCISRGGGHSSRFLWVKVRQVYTIYKKYKALDYKYYMGTARMILFMNMKRLLGNRIFNVLSTFKYLLRRKE